MLPTRSALADGLPYMRRDHRPYLPPRRGPTPTRRKTSKGCSPMSKLPPSGARVSSNVLLVRTALERLLRLVGVTPREVERRLGFGKESRYVARRLSPDREIKLRELFEILDAVEVSPPTFFSAAFPSRPAGVGRSNDHLCGVLAALPPPKELEGIRDVAVQEPEELTQPEEEKIHV
jgi:hypothetical protein